MLLTLSLHFHASHPLPRPRPPPAPPHDVVGVVALKGVATFLLFPSVFSLENTITCTLFPLPLVLTPFLPSSNKTMSNTVTRCPVPSSLLHCLSLNPSSIAHLTLPQEPCHCPRPRPSARIQTNPVTEYHTYRRSHPSHQKLPHSNLCTGWCSENHCSE